jgi:Prion-inhibition and propagation
MRSLERGHDEADSDGEDEKPQTATWRRVRCAIRDLDKFDSLIKDLAQRINKLNDLMTETQQQKTQEDNYRIIMVVVGSAVDEASLELIRTAVRAEPHTSSVRSAIERNALVVEESNVGIDTDITAQSRPS